MTCKVFLTLDILALYTQRYHSSLSIRKLNSSIIQKNGIVCLERTFTNRSRFQDFKIKMESQDLQPRGYVRIVLPKVQSKDWCQPVNCLLPVHHQGHIGTESKWLETSQLYGVDITSNCMISGLTWSKSYATSVLLNLSGELNVTEAMYWSCSGVQYRCNGNVKNNQGNINQLFTTHCVRSAVLHRPNFRVRKSRFRKLT